LVKQDNSGGGVEEIKARKQRNRLSCIWNLFKTKSEGKAGKNRFKSFLLKHCRFGVEAQKPTFGFGGVHV